MNDDISWPHERMRIVCKTAADETETELPLRMLFVGDYAGHDERPVEDRVPVRVDRDSFSRVLAAHAPKLDLVVSGAEQDAQEGALRVVLTFRDLGDFGPDRVAEQIPETARLLAVRDALTRLKASGDVTAFHATLKGLFEDEAVRAQLLAGLGLGSL